jgi:hypothetical protein
MPDELIQRRQLLRGAGIAAGGAAVAGLGAVAAPAAADDDHDRGRARLTGSWLVDVANDDGSSTVSVGSFAEGGVCVIHDIQPAGPPFTGSWKMRDKRRWRATVLGGFAGEDGPGSAGPTIELRLRGEVGRREISGSFTFTVTAPDGTDVAAGSGTFSGRRIEA